MFKTPFKLSMSFIACIALLGMSELKGQTMWLMVNDELETANKISGKSSVQTMSHSLTKDIANVKVGSVSDKMGKYAPVYGWRKDVTATIFWVGEKACRANPVHNKSSSWDVNWVTKFGGVDSPTRRSGFNPKGFSPKMNPFYIALPYNDISSANYKHKSEAESLIWWFDESFKSRYLSVCKGRWLAIEYKGKICYAQWEDCGPFETNDWKYVFQNERPKKNVNKSAGIDLSPAIRDYLGIQSGKKVSWKFVEEEEVNQGPWSLWLSKRVLSKNP